MLDGPAMRIYKLTPQDPQVHEISTEEAFLSSLPQRGLPWVGKDQSEKRTVYYAVCPFCHNPIRMVGLLHKTDAKVTPYAKHYPHSIQKLAAYVQEAYEYCIYANKNKVFGNKNLRRQDTDPESLNLLQLVKTELDRMIKILSEDSGIFYNLALIEKMLVSYRETTGWTYKSSYPYNLPWTFANIITCQTLFGRYIYQHSDLAQKLQQLDFIKLEPTDDGKLYRVKSSSSKFLALTFEFRNLKLVQCADGGTVPHTTFVVHYQPTRSLSSLRTVYSKEIDIDEMRFQRALQTPRDKDEEKFADKCRELAAKILP